MASSRISRRRALSKPAASILASRCAVARGTTEVGRRFAVARRTADEVRPQANLRQHRGHDRRASNRGALHEGRA